MAVNGGYGFEKAGEFYGIKDSIRSHSRTQVHAERMDGFDGVPYVLCRKATCQKDWHINLIPNLPAERPVMDAPCASQLLHRQRGIA